MKITIFGSGYVGLVTGACLADVGNDVLCMDINKVKIESLRKDIIPIYEPDLDLLIKRNSVAGRLRFTSKPEEAVKHGEFQFIAVDTPLDEKGSADLQYVFAVAEAIAKNIVEYRIIVNKSTVPVGTTDKIYSVVSEILSQADKKINFDIVSNPEFLKEGEAVNDFIRPDRIIVGADNEVVIEKLRHLYAPFNRNHDRFIAMDVRSAELTKYAANAMLATKISFMNEFANLAERLGADIESVRKGIGSDTRIGYSFIYPGCGYGGSCLPKDISALKSTAKSVGYNAQLLNAVQAVNQRQKFSLFTKITEYFGQDLSNKVFALWGLAFKPNTDDMREAPSRVLMEALWEAGATIRAFDPVAMSEAARIYPNNEKLRLAASALDAVEGADALIVVTEWSLFRGTDFNQVKRNMKDTVVFDGRNMFNPEHMESLGIDYCSIGRPRINRSRVGQ